MVVVLSIGIFGNMLSFVVFFRSRKRADACVQYLGCLALSDTAVIASRGVTEWINSGLKYLTDGALAFNLFQYSSLSCKTVTYFQQVSMCISGWMIVLFSLERAYVVIFPLKRNDITAVKRKRIIAATCIVMVVLAIHRLFLIDIIDSTPKFCFYTTDPDVGAFLYQFDVALYTCRSVSISKSRNRKDNP
jgi:hypothetical protein